MFRVERGAGNPALHNLCVQYQNEGETRVFSNEPLPPSCCCCFWTIIRKGIQREVSIPLERNIWYLCCLKKRYPHAVSKLLFRTPSHYSNVTLTTNALLIELGGCWILSEVSFRPLPRLVEMGSK